MTRVYIDAETFSSVDLPIRGLDNYWDPAADTGWHCLAIKRDEGPIRLCKPGDPFFYELQEDIDAGALIVAHKAEFEFYLLQKMGFKVPLQQFRCTMAKARAMGFPPSLGKLSLALGFKQGKDTAGQRAMKILCKPNPATGRHWEYRDAPDLFEALYKYCIHDVQLEYDIDQLLPDLSDEEQARWVLDQQINRRGIGVDRPAAAAAYEICTAELAHLDTEIKEASGGQIDSTKAVIQIARFCGMDSVDKDHLEQALNVDDHWKLTVSQRRVLEIRQAAAQSSTLKLKPMLELCGSDGRVRWTQAFNGAATGRWSGQNPQPHNFPRGELHLTEAEQALFLDTLARTGGVNFPERWVLRDRKMGLDVTNRNMVKECLRGLFVAAPGHEFSSFDFAQIEMRYGAWFVQDEGLLEEFRGEGKIYELTYADAFHIDKKDVTGDQRQGGKVMALGAQFQGGAQALITSAWKNCRMLFDPNPVLAEEIADDLKVRWRASHPNFPPMWKQLEQCAKMAILNPGQDCVTRPADRGVSYKVPLAADGTPGSVLCCTLPSSRVICYPFPRIERRTVTKKNGETWETDSVTYMVVEDSQWRRTAGYGGLFFNNIIQGGAADLLRYAITNMNNEGIPIVMMVHDEVLTETPIGSLDWKRGAEIMERQPAWALDLPIKVTGWVGKRYRKE